MISLRAEEVASFAERELSLIADPTVRAALAARLIPPELHLRNWEYGADDERYPCWTVAKDVATDSAIVYSAHGHGPECPWGLVSLSEPWFGMDCGWFRVLEDAFVDSFMATSLEIWDLVAPNGRAVLSSVTHHDAFARRDSLDAGLPRPIHHVQYRSRHPEGVR